MFPMNAWLTPANECEWGADTPNLDYCIDQIDFGELYRVFIYRYVFT